MAQPQWQLIENAYVDLEDEHAIIEGANARIGNAHGVLREQLPRIANIPVANNMAQIQVMLVAMEARLTAGMTGLRNEVTQLRNEATQLLNDLNGRVDILTQVVQVNERNGHARALNASVRDEFSPLTPLVRSNGEQLPPDLFPATCREFRDLTGQRLTELLNQYELNVPIGTLLVDRRRRLAQHCAVSL
ncbi:hypothetical protein RSOLAG1IB_11054 [Rhizoctonia solani AG-1 IB]|uniref:Uncharacterized protein n=1 Tax=Thanatephorus cucumeris (strain AG1-IB / isolate 7/3/14) TaxID=1108050 RepID=A0A0B7G294_THACB|nr:hypothetical protein RSOLAG1IB_11054 [Rhizoctonia solani AG-1 IB]